MTAAERRAAEVRATRAPREPRPEPTRPEVTREEWIDEGSIREEATRAAGRARSTAVEPSRRVDERVEPGAPRRRSTGQVAPEVREELEELVPAARLDRYQDRLAAAADALDRGRFARGEPAQDGRPDFRRIVLVISLETITDAISLKKLAGGSRVLAQDEVSCGEGLKAAHRHVGKIANGRRHKV